MSIFITNTSEAEAATSWEATTQRPRKENLLPADADSRGTFEIIPTLAAANLSGAPRDEQPGRKRTRLRKGLTVAIIGPDGAGKSTLARGLGASAAFPAEVVYMGGNPESSLHVLPTTRLLVRYGKWKVTGGSNRKEHGGQAQATITGRLAFGARETVKFVNELLEYSYRFLFAWAARRRGSVVIFDRYVYDAWIDAIADKASLWRWLRAGVLRLLFPKPDVLLVLEASPDLLFARKGEHSPERLARVQAACRNVATGFKRVAYIDASQPREQVLQEATIYISKYLGRRRIRRQ